MTWKGELTSPCLCLLQAFLLPPPHSPQTSHQSQTQPIACLLLKGEIRNPSLWVVSKQDQTTPDLASQPSRDRTAGITYEMLSTSPEHWQETQINCMLRASTLLQEMRIKRREEQLNINCKESAEAFLCGSLQK